MTAQLVESMEEFRQHLLVRGEFRVEVLAPRAISIHYWMQGSWLGPVFVHTDDTVWHVLDHSDGRPDYELHTDWREIFPPHRPTFYVAQVADESDFGAIVHESAHWTPEAADRRMDEVIADLRERREPMFRDSFSKKLSRHTIDD